MGKEVYICPAAFHPREYRWIPISSHKLTQVSTACSRTTWVERLLEVAGLGHPDPNWQRERAVRCASSYITHPQAGEWGEWTTVLGKASFRLFVLYVEPKALQLAWTHLPLPFSSAFPHTISGSLFPFLLVQLAPCWLTQKVMYQSHSPTTPQPFCLCCLCC